MKYPNFYFEKKLWKQGFKHIAGVDEVGRGCFAGPVVAAACVFASIKNSKFQTIDYKKHREFKINNSKPVYINDSKKLTPRQREVACEWIKDNALTWGIGEVPVAKINRLGMGRATKMAFRRAVSDAKKRFGKRIDYLLIDAFYIPYFQGFPAVKKTVRKNHKLKDRKARQLAIVNGDAKSITIGAASIVAKVYRDKLMLKLSKNLKYKKYGWGRNKGYGTREHQEAIKNFGITRYHRKQFVETFLGN